MSSNQKKHVLIVAGEASADLHGSNLILAMKDLAPETVFQGIGGKMMEEVGVRTLFSSADMAVVGLTEVLSKLSRITKAYFRLRSILKSDRPNLLILLDYPDFNISLARAAKRFNVPVLYYISPQIWAWRRGRVKKIAERVDRMAVILPFEKELYHEKGVNVAYVGHPLIDALPESIEKNEIRRKLDLENTRPILALLPGSRDKEVSRLLPPMIKASEIIARSHPNLKCLVPVAPTISPALIQSLIEQSPLDIKMTFDGTYNTLSVCDLALVASGTATLEVAIMQVPMVIVYQVSPVSYWIGKRVVKVPHIGLANLVAGKEIVPELIQDQVTPQRLAEEALNIMESGQKRESMVENLKKVKERLGQGGASRRTARIALEMMGE